MRHSNWKFKMWTKFLNSVIIAVAFRIVIRVECVEYRTYDVITDGSGIGRLAEVAAMPQDQFASRRGSGSLDIRSQYWTRTRKDPEYPEEPEADLVGMTEEESESRPYVQVDRTGKEHTVTINMPRMERRGSRNHMIKKFVLQPVIQYVVQYDKDSQKETGEEAQASTNFEDYEGYQGQEKMVKSHGRSVDRFFNDIDAKFETYWGNDGSSGGGGYSDGGGDSMTGDNSGGGSQGGYDDLGESGGFDVGGSQGGYNGAGGGSQGSFDNGNANFGGAAQGFNQGYSSNGAAGSSGSAQSDNGGGGRAQVAGSQSAGSQGGNVIAHDFGYTVQGATGGYNSANQFHQPPDVNAYVSSGGYGVPSQQQGGFGGGMVSMQGGMGGMSMMGNTGQMGNAGQQPAPMYNAPSGSMGMGGMSGMGGTGGGSMGGMAQGASLGGMGMQSNGPMAHLNSLYGVPGMTPGKPHGLNMMMSGMGSGGGGAAGTSSSANPMMSMGMMQGQIAQGQIVPGSVAAASGAMMGVGAPSMLQGVMPSAVGMGSGSSSAVMGGSSGMSSMGMGVNAAAAGGGGVGAGMTLDGMTSSIASQMNIGGSGAMAMGAAAVAGGGSMGSSGVSMAYGPPGPMGMGNAAGMSMGSPSAAYGPPSMPSGGDMGGSSPNSQYGPPSKNPSSGGYGGGSSSEDDGGDNTPPSNRGKKKKPGSGGKSKGRGRGAAKSLLASLPLPKIPQSIGGHLSFMFSTGVGKGRRNRGSMSGGGGKPGGDNSKGLDKEKVSKHILNILGLTPVHQQLLNATLANSSSTNPILVWEQNGNRTSLDHTSLIPEDTPEDVVDLLHVDKYAFPIPNVTLSDSSEEQDSLFTSTLNSTLLEATSNPLPTFKPSTTPTAQTEHLLPKSSNRILIATIPPPIVFKPPNNTILIATVPPQPPKSTFPPFRGSLLNSSILIATMSTIPARTSTLPTPKSTYSFVNLTTPAPITTTTSQPASPKLSSPPSTSTNKPILIATVPPPSISSSTPSPPTETTSISTTPIPTTTTTLPPLSTPTTTLAPNNTNTTTEPNISQRVRTRPRQGKNLTPPQPPKVSKSPTEIILTPKPTRPHPTPSISIEIDPIQDYINHNLGNNVLTVNNGQRYYPQPPFPFPPYPHSPVRRPNIQAYYAEHNLAPNPVKIENFDPLIYDALQAAFQPQAHNNLFEDGRKRKRSRFPNPYFRSPFLPFSIRPRSRGLLGRISNRFSKKTLGGSNDTLSIIPSQSLSLKGTQTALPVANVKS